MNLSDIKDHKDHPEIFEGDKVIITDWDFANSNEAVKLSKLPFLVVDGVDKHPIGSEGDYHWEYGIYVKELPGALLAPHNYKKYNK
jgi:hypothetical protein